MQEAPEIARRAHDVYGVPAWLERSAMRVALTLSVALLFYVVAFMAGLAPALTQERDLVAFIRASSVGSDPRVTAALHAIDSSVYISKADVQVLAGVAEIALAPKDFPN